MNFTRIKVLKQVEEYYDIPQGTDLQTINIEFFKNNSPNISIIKGIQLLGSNEFTITKPKRKRKRKKKLDIQKTNEI